MAIRKRTTGWQVRVKPFPEITVPTKTAAETVELDLKLRKKLGHLYQEKPVTFGDELDASIERRVSIGGRRGKLRPKTVAFLEQTAAGLKPLRNVMIPNLRRALVEDTIARRARHAPTSAANELELIKTTLRAAASRGQTVDPGIFEIPAVRVEPAEGIAITYERLLDIGSFMPGRVGRIVPFCGTTGLRFTEAVTLTDDRVDLDAGEILIPRDLNKSRVRKGIPLARLEVQLLREQLLARPAGSRFVFPTKKGRAYTKSGFRSVWVPALTAAGLTHQEQGGDGLPVTVADFRFHWLRHTAISLMAQAGMKPELIAERVGHKDGGALIYRRYRHLFPTELRDAVAMLDTLLDDTAGGRRAVADDA